MRASGLLLLLLSSFIFAAHIGSALKFGFSPSEVHLSSSQRCDDIYVFSSEAIRIDFEERWSEKESTDLRDYVNSGDNFLAHNQHIEFRGEDRFQVCLYKTEAFYSHGLLLMHIANSSFSGGIWIKIDESGKNQIKKSVVEGNSSTIITGFASNLPAKISLGKNTLLMVVLGEFAFLEVLILSLFCAHLRRKKSPS